MLPLLAGPARGQSERLVVRFPLKLVDFAIVADTTDGVQLLAIPSVNTDRGKSGSALIWLRIHPDTVMDWVNGAAVALRQLGRSGPSSGIQWSPALRGRRGAGTFAMGRERKNGALARKHWLAIADSAGGWRTDIGPVEGDSILKVLFLAASQARLDTSSTGTDNFDTEIEVVEQPEPKYRGILGRVVAQFVVTAEGRADPDTFVALLASDPELVAEARASILATRYRPATRAGRPVRRLAVQMVSWQQR